MEPDQPKTKAGRIRRQREQISATLLEREQKEVRVDLSRRMAKAPTITWLL